jgi:LysM repeat protein/ABC-type branched-subunit amino acid transport system substrate-binding protein
MKMMKHRYLALCGILACLTGAAPAVFAQDYQPVPVTISRSQVSEKGKTYYVHIVLERQTIYGITKAYGVTEEDLYAANPTLAQEGLKAGTVIYIPVVSKEKASGSTVDTTPARTPDADGYIQHTVKWFEDIYDVAGEYNVTAQEIMAANGLKSSRISKRQTLRIPVTDKARENLKKEFPNLASLPVNPPAKAETPKTEPAAPAKPVVSQPEPVVVPEKPVTRVTEPEEKKAVEEENVEAPSVLLDWLSGMSGKGTAELALILPFNASGRASESNMDFYSGVLMALRTLEKEGVKTTLNVYDLQAGIPSSFDLGKNDFILGPITTNDLTTILGVTGGRIPVVSPLDQKAGDLASTHDGFIQAPSSTASQYTELVAWADEERARGDQVILVTEKSSNGSTAPAVGLREALLAAGTSFEGVTLTQGESRSLSSALTSRLVKGGVNRIILASENETFVSNLVGNLGILLGRGYKIVVYAPSRVRTFDSIDVSLYHQCSLHICSPYFADYDAENVKSFIRTYRALYRTEPSQFAFQGYDLAHYFATLVAKYGNRWTRALEQVPGSGIHTDFRFEPVRKASYRNTGIRRIIYDPDYSTILAR